MVLKRTPTTIPTVAHVIVALPLALVGCSSSPTTGGGFGGGTETGSGQGGGSSIGSGTSGGGSTGSPAKGSGVASNTSSSPAATSGSGAGSSTGTGTQTGMPATSPSSAGGAGMMMAGSPSGAPTAGSGSGSPPATTSTIPTTQGFTDGPPGATDLAPPAAADGIQFATPPGAYTVQPGQEIFPNYCVVTQSDIQVGGFQAWMTQGSSHHFILYNGGAVAAGTADGNCSGGGHSWMFAESTPGTVITDIFPPNVGLDVPANTELIINMHFVNPGSAASSPQVKLNLLTAKNVMYQAGTMVSFNVQINVPAATASGPGMQTVSGTCTAPAGANFFSMSTHTHKHATAAWVDFTHNGQTQQIVYTGATSSYPPDQEQGSGTDWEHPGVGTWVAPNFLTVQAGDSFDYNCSYVNNDSMAVTVGETATYNEMCMAVGYYFPAGSAYCQ